MYLAESINRSDNKLIPKELLHKTLAYRVLVRIVSLSWQVEDKRING